MNETLHLNPDTLSAFAEGALPAHEREATLAHLAVCPLCRELVQLAQPPVEQLQAGAVLPARRGWRWLWAGAAACAGIGLATVVLLHPPSQHTVTAPMTAKMEAPPLAPPVPAMVAPQARPQKAPALKLAPADKQAAVIAQAAPALAKAAPAGGAVGMEAANGLAVGPAAPVAEPARASAGAASPLGEIANRERAAVNLQSLKAPQSASVGGVPAPAPPPLRAMAAAAPQQVTVDANSMAMDVSNASLAQLLPELPSHLATTSRYAEGERVVAVDTAGTVFVSKDAGRHWSGVKAGWGGRVVRVGSAGDSLSPPVQVLGQCVQDKAGPGSATLQGTVSDASGAVIPGASITIAGTGMQVLSDRSGNYVLRGLAAGQHQLRVESPGFATATIAVTLADGRRDQQNVRLQAGTATETITVTDASPMGVAKAKKAVAAFALVTDSGERWVSVDGKKWKRQ